MVSTRKILPRTSYSKANSQGNILPLSGERTKRILPLIMRKRAFGSYVKLEFRQAFGDPGKWEIEALARMRQTLDQTETHALPPRMAETMQVRIRTREIANLISALRPGFIPSLSRVLAVTALEFGLNSHELRRHSRSLCHFWLKERQTVPWAGVPTALCKAIWHKHTRKTGLLAAVERTLFARGHVSTDARRLCASLQTPWTQLKISRLISTALNFLETCGLARRLPLAVYPDTGSLTVWCHTAFQNPVIDYPNVDMDVLRRLYRSPQPIGGLVTPQTSPPTPKTFGNPDARFTYATVNKHLRFLAEAGLVVLTLPDKVYRLTEEGRRLMSIEQSTHELPERLRRILLRGG